MPDKAGEFTAAEFLLATVSSINSSGASLIFDGQTAASQKRYKILGTGIPVAAGDRVVVMKHSGTYIVIGSITAAGASVYYTNKLTDVATAGGSFSVSTFYYSQFGKIAQFYCSGKTTAALTANAWNTLITLKAGRRPYSQVIMDIWNNYLTVLTSAGAANLWGTVATDTSLTFSAEFILA